MNHQVAKVTPPRGANAVPRPRLFARLDALRRRGGALWVEGVPGAGKTTLLSSWLQARRVRSLWLKVDEGDRDLATFFHYLTLAAGAAARRRRTPLALPALTPEYAGAHEAFARNFFRQLFAVLRRGTVIVLDDVQEANGQLQEVLRALLEEAVPSVPVIIASRAPPGAALARFRADGSLSVISGPSLHLTRRETLALARRRGFAGTSAALEALVSGAQGWPAGVVLRVLESPDGRASPHGATADHQFFIGEVLARVDPATRRLLLEAALLPPASEVLLIAATGEPKAGSVVASLAERGLFTLRRETTPPTFELHALFRDFLRARGEQELTPARRAEVRRAAARRLAAEGSACAEAAIDLLAEAGAFEELAEVVAREAPGALREGRWQTVERWLGAMPPAVREGNPWLQLWAGGAATARRPAEAREPLERALAMFEAAGVAPGVWQAWAARVQAVVAEWNDLTPLVGALADHDRLRQRFPCPPGEIEERVLLAAHAAAGMARPDHPEFPAWCQRLRDLAASSPAPSLRLAAGSQLVMHEACMHGEIERHRKLVGTLGRLALAPETPPSVSQLWLCTQASAAFADGDLDTCGPTVARALAHGELHGLHLWDFCSRAVEFSVALLRDPERVPERIRAMERAVRPGAGADLNVYEWARGMAALQRGEAHEAVRHCEEAVAHARTSGFANGHIMARLLLARARARAGDVAGARSVLGEVRALGERSGSAWLRCVTSFIEAEHLLDEGRSEHWVEPLAEAFRIARDKGVHPFMIFGLEDAARLCAAALSRGLDPGFVRAFVRTWRLSPPAGAAGIEAWPWPVRIRALGTFAVERDGEPVGASGRIPRRPLDLLRILVAHGGREVPEHVAAETLWPDAEGDAAQHSLETTLYRLRRLVGPDVVVQRDRRLSLSPQRCWVDAFELEARLGAALAALEHRRRVPGPPAGAETDAERIAQLYRGPLFSDVEDSAWAQEARARLRRKTVRWLDSLAATLGDPGRIDALRARFRARDSDLQCAAVLHVA